MALRELNARDLEDLIKFVSVEPEVNLYILGDLEAYGLGHPVSVAALDNDSTWAAVVLDLHNNFVVYSRDCLCDHKAIAEHIKHYAVDGIPRHLNARLDIAQALAPHFPEMTLDECKLATCTMLDDSYNQPASSKVTVREMKDADYGELIDLYNEIEESTQRILDSDERNQAIRRKIESARNGCETVGIYKSGRLVSAASTSAAYSRGAMLTGVATLPKERGCGYATLAVERLCSDCFNRGMDHICLYYNNPVAARIYKRIGFKDIADFGMLSKR